MKYVELIPNASVGQFILGDNIDHYLKHKFTYFKKAPNDKYMEDYYEFLEPPIIVFVNEKNAITTINCTVECFWKDQNLLELSFNEFLNLAGVKPDGHEKIFVLMNDSQGETQDVYDFGELGLQIWLLKGTIVTVSCTNYNL